MNYKLLTILTLVLFSIIVFAQSEEKDGYVIIGYDYIYENLSKEVPIYQYNIIEVKEECWFNKSIGEDTCIPARNYTTKELVGYKTEYYDGDKIGVNIDGKETTGAVNIQDDILSQWRYIPLKGRNLEEFGKCRDFEVEKGVCTMTNLLEEIKIEG